MAEPTVFAAAASTRSAALHVHVAPHFGASGEPECEASPPRETPSASAAPPAFASPPKKATALVTAVSKKRALSATASQSRAMSAGSDVATDAAAENWKSNTIAADDADDNHGHDDDDTNDCSNNVTTEPSLKGSDASETTASSSPRSPQSPTSEPCNEDAMTGSNTTAPSIDPHDLVLLKVIGRGTFAQQVALARHVRTQRMYVVKTLDKRQLAARKQLVHTLGEKQVLEALGGDGGHPFVVRLFGAFQTERDLHFVFEYCQGGELFFHLQQQRAQRFDECAARFYAAEVLAALHALHARGVVYRDLKPENVLLDAAGHVKLADFGFAKQHMPPGARTYSFCGSPEYLSPEMVAKDGHGAETDMWSFGCFCYELLTGAPPFPLGSRSLGKLFELIRTGRVWYPPELSGPAVSLLEGLLCVRPSARLTAAQAMDHPFFRPLDWADVLQRQVPPPIVPRCAGADCTQNFDDGFTREPVVSLRLGGPAAASNSGDQQPKRARPDASTACGFYAADPLAEFEGF